MFRGPWDAIQYAYVCRKGPNYSTMKWDDMPYVRRSSDTHSVVRTMLRGVIGVQPDSKIERELIDAALNGGPKTPKCRAVARRLRKLLAEHEMLIEGPVMVDLPVQRWVDDEGIEWVWLGDKRR